VKGLGESNTERAPGAPPARQRTKTTRLIGGYPWFSDEMKVYLVAFAVFIWSLSSCQSSPAPAPTLQQEPQQAPVFPEKPILSKAAWLERILKAPDEQIDLIEAATVLANHKTHGDQPYSSIPRFLSPSLRKVKLKVGDGKSPDAMIDALNEELLPELQRARKGQLRWLYETLGSEQGGCVVSSILYLIAADAIGLRLDPVLLPRHMLLTSITPERRRNIETTSRGEELPTSRYRELVSTPTEHPETLPEAAEDLEKCFGVISRRQFVSTLLCQTEASKAADPSDYEAAARVAPDLWLPLKMLSAYSFTREDYSQSEKDLNRAIQLAPHIPGLFGLRASTRLLQNKPAAALEDAEQALVLSPHYGRYYYTKGIILRMAGRLEESLSAFARATEAGPKVAEYWDFRGTVAALLKRYPAAISDFSKAIDLAPETADYYESRAKMWAMVGDEKNYEGDRRKALELKNRP
jgi:tetratricopeptide (TPR) repeat protein